jgi:hypothetical protein
MLRLHFGANLTVVRINRESDERSQNVDQHESEKGIADLTVDFDISNEDMGDVYIEKALERLRA